MNRFKIDRKGIARLQYMPEMHKAVTVAATTVADVARVYSPRRTGHYATSLTAEHMGYPWARARIYARDFKANWIEGGAGPSPVRGGRPFIARHTLQRAVISVGLDYRGVGR